MASAETTQLVEPVPSAIRRVVAEHFGIPEQSLASYDKYAAARDTTPWEVFFYLLNGLAGVPVVHIGMDFGWPPGVVQRVHRDAVAWAIEETKPVGQAVAELRSKFKKREVAAVPQKLRPEHIAREPREPMTRTRQAPPLRPSATAEPRVHREAMPIRPDRAARMTDGEKVEPVAPRPQKPSVLHLVKSAVVEPDAVSVPPATPPSPARPKNHQPAARIAKLPTTRAAAFAYLRRTILELCESKGRAWVYAQLFRRGTGYFWQYDRLVAKKFAAAKHAKTPVERVEHLSWIGAYLDIMGLLVSLQHRIKPGRMVQRRRIQTRLRTAA